MTNVLSVLSSGGKAVPGTTLTVTCGSGTSVLTIAEGTSTLTPGMQVSGLTQIPANTFIESIYSSTQIIISEDTTNAAIGLSAKFTSVNHDVPTNPHMNLIKGLSPTHRLYTGIFSDDSLTSSSYIKFNEVGTTTANTERQNLVNTEGYKIKCYDSSTGEGVRLIDATSNYSDSDFSTYHYFVLLHSDNHLLHHFARITQVTSGDTAGDSFEFEPRLGEEITKGTKFMIFRGPAKTTNPLAISAGIKMDLQFDLQVSRPLFYFFDESMDKDGQLNHGTKYYSFCENTNSSGEVNLATGLQTTFLTVTDYAQDIVDYSRYNLRATVVDNLKTLDAPLTNTSNEAHTVHALDFTDYDKAFPNARRDDDDDHTTLQFRGPSRYLHYKYSPDKSNQAFGVFDNIVYESYGQRGGYAETKIADMFRIQDKKIVENEGYRVRHKVHTSQLDGWFDLEVEVLSASSPTYTFTTTHDLNNFLNANDEIKIGSTLFIIASIGTFVAATATTPASQPITLLASSAKYHKTDEVAGTFIDSTDPTISVGDKLYRRAFNKTDKTLLTSFPLVADRYENLFINFISGDFAFLRATVTAIDVEKKLMTLDFIDKTYGIGVSNSALEWLSGEYEIEIEKFNGSIENIDSYLENGQRIIQISGRNNYSKLLSPAVNKNTIHSQDIIYSSNSPFNDVTLITGSPLLTCSFDSKTVDFDSTHHFDNSGSPAYSESADVGTHLYAYHTDHANVSYVGKIATVNSSTRVTLENYALVESDPTSSPSSDAVGAKATSKHYMFNKALSTNSFQNTSTDLTAASNKGIFFESGQSLTSAGAESATLIGTSSSSDSRALGHYLSDTVRIKSDSAFQARLSNNGSAYQDFDTVNTLIDFSILSIKKSDGRSLVEIAPHIPLTLGRVDINFANTQDTTFTDLGACTTGTSGNTYFTIDKDAGGGTTTSDALLSTTASPRKLHNKPVYANGVFLGKIITVTLHTDHDTIYVYLDRKLTSTISTHTIQILAESTFLETGKLTHELALLNAGHLHTGKIISLLSPHVNSDSLYKTLSMNYPFHYGDKAHEYYYSEKYGSPYFRIINLEKGNYNRINTTSTTDIKDVSEYYLETVSKVPYYASSYRFGLGNYIESFSEDYPIVGVGKTGKNAADDYSTHRLPESRGNTSVYGSRFFDSDLHHNGASAQRVLFTHDPTITNVVADVPGTHENIFTAKDHLDLLDYKVSRMFLFATSDLHPYSSRRHDSLMHSFTVGGASYNNDPTITHTSSSDIIAGMSVSGEGIPEGSTVASVTDATHFELSVSTTGGSLSSQILTFSQTRDISNYNFLALEAPIETSSSDIKEGTIGKTNTLTLNDSNYSSASIESADRTISELKRFSLMRLTEVVIDWAFNQIDPENIISKERVLPMFKYSTFQFNSLATCFSSSEVATADYQDYTVTGCTYDNDPTILCSSAKLRVGMPVSGPGIPTGAVIASLNGGSAGVSVTSFELSASTTGGAQGDGGSSANQTLTFGSYIATDTSVNPGTILAPPRTIIADSNGRYIGEVAAIDGSGSSWKIILMDKARKTNGTSYFAGTLYLLHELRNTGGTANQDFVPTIRGHGKGDTFVKIKEEVHMMKSIVMNDVGNPSGAAHYGHGTSSAWYRENSVHLDTAALGSADKSFNTYLPIDLDSTSIFGDTSEAASQITDHPYQLFDTWHGSLDEPDSSDAAGDECLYNPFLPIFLDRFNVEDGGGSLVSKGTVGGPVESISFRSSQNVGSDFCLVGMGLLNDFAEHEDGIGSHANRTYAKDADGVMMGFKPRLYLETGSPYGNKAAGNRDIYHYVIELDTDVTSITYFDEDVTGNSSDFANINRKSLRLMNDLTGCYLVSEKGKYYDDEFVVQTYSDLFANTPSLNEQTPNIIAYVISHEIDTTNSAERHILTLDTEIVTDFYRVMQPNHVCFYKYSPKKIRLNTLSSAYTKISGENGCYVPSEINSYMVRDTSGGRSFTRFHNTGGKEAALSMYVAIDTDAQSDSNFIVQRVANKMESLLTPNSDFIVAVSDGDNAYKTSMTYTDNGDDIGHFLTFDKMEETLGVASISETITLTVNGDLSLDAKRGMIGSVATVCYEADDLINDLLETNDIEFTSEDSDFPYFLAPNYKGIDLFSAINLVLNKKNRRLIEEPAVTTIYNPKESIFKLANNLSTSNFPKVLLSDDGDHQIFEYKKVKSVFDFYNEVIVYGKAHKGSRKNLRSVKKLGRKTLEVYESDLTSQEAVNQRAGELLRLHSSDNVRLNITVGHTNISQIRAGDVVQVELLKEGIELDDYIVLQIEHDYLGMLRLELGKYSKQLEDRFAELLATNKKIYADIRAKEFDERSVSYDLLDSINVNVSKLLVRKIVGGSGASLGFGSALNTSGTPMGFTGGAVDTITNLVEEEY